VVQLVVDVCLVEAIEQVEQSSEDPACGVTVDLSHGCIVPSWRTSHGHAAGRARSCRCPPARPGGLNDPVTEHDARVVSRMLDEWDPIGVYEGDGGPPPGEYDRLVGPVLTKLRSGDDAQVIAAYLTWDVRTNMGLRSRPDADLEAAERLHTWFHGLSDQ
jgi:hypothetical protein